MLPTEVITPAAVENSIPEELIPISGSPRLNKTINAIGVGLVSLVSAFLATKLSNRTGNQSLVDPSWDGKILSCADCNKEGICGIEPNSKCNTDGLPVAGKSPQVKGKGPCQKSPQKKVYYINGIDTPPVNNCKTSKKLAGTLCAEVVSMYNRTKGIKGDLFECVRSIRKSDKVPPADAMEELIENHFGNPPKEPYLPLELYAHSQGGLITQQALIRYKDKISNKIGSEDAEKILKNIKVKSFGTAEKGWPNGPEYEQFTNEFDPVPKVIAAAQKKYKKETFTEDTLSCKIAKNHTFAIPFGNPIHSHSMDNVYIEKLKETRESTQEDKCSVCPH